MNIKRYHTPVMLTEVVESLNVVQGGRYIDGTLGEGGHSEAILATSQPGGQLLGIDADHEAIMITKERLSDYSKCSFFVNSKFSKMKDIALELEFVPVHGVLLDLGISSLQLDFEDRGFSFKDNSDLDMRFDISQYEDASKIINNFSEKDLSNLIFKFSEDPNSKRIARAICQKRPIITSKELAKVIQEADLKVRRKHHPATLTFQALRMAVNKEVDELIETLQSAISILGSGGRLVVITYHSIEERIVKNFIREGSGLCQCPPINFECICNPEKILKIINKKPIVPSDTEIKVNSRSRSAKIRVIERL
tara:strand:- start:76 stop:1002 length:927 start_codon:yes stop_codon:yes gene_type:complete